MDDHDRMNEVTGRRDLLPLVAVLFSLASLGIFLYVFFGDVEKELKGDAIYWFLIALAAAMLPHIRQIRFRDLELTLREEISKNREEIDQRVDNLQAFMSSVTSVELSEASLSQEQRENRERVYKDFSRRLQKAESDKRVSLQERFTQMHLSRFGITLASVKTALAELGLYKGEITNEFDADTAEAIRHYQEMNGLDADGILGPMTYQHMTSYLSGKAKE